MAVVWNQVTSDDVLRAMQEYDRLGPEAFFPRVVSARLLLMISSRANAVTRRKRSWARPMSSLLASGSLRVISKAGRAGPSRCSKSWVSRSSTSRAIDIELEHVLPSSGMAFLVVAKPRPHVTLITLNRPERMNAMSFDVMIPFRRALEEISHDNDTRVVVVTGAGAGFCSGADLVDSGHIPDIDGLTRPGVSLRAMELLDDVILSARKMHQPVVGAINGPAIGGGFCLALAFDIRVAGQRAYFRAARSLRKAGLSHYWCRA
jgi:hypothetical protein